MKFRPCRRATFCANCSITESGKTLIFARTKRGTERLAKDLMRDGFAASMIHGDRTQSQRSAALAGFEAGRFQVLVATDVAARGIHVGDVAHVVNYDLPSHRRGLHPSRRPHRPRRTFRPGDHDRQRRRDDRAAPLRAHPQTAHRTQGTGQDEVIRPAQHADSDHPRTEEYEHVEVAHAEQPAGRDLRVSYTDCEDARGQSLWRFLCPPVGSQIRRATQRDATTRHHATTHARNPVSNQFRLV